MTIIMCFAAFANTIVGFNFPVDTWVDWKLYGGITITIVAPLISIARNFNKQS